MTAALKLYEHAEAVQQVEAWLLEADDELLARGGVLPPELEELLATSLAGFREKVERVALVALGLEATAEAIDGEMKRLAARKKALENRAAWIRRYLQHNLEAAHETKVEGVRCTVALQKGAPQLVGDVGAEQLEEWLGHATLAEFVRVVPSKLELDRRGLLAAVKEERVRVPGISVETRSSLRIR